MIHCRYDELLPRSALKPHPKNHNKHPEDQIARLAKLIKYQGIRAPIVISKLSGYIVKGHGTSEACWLNGLDKVPVVYQDFESEDQEYAFLQSDNAIASWAELDLSAINADIGELGPAFDIDLLGIKDFTIDVADKFQGDEDDVPATPKEARTKLGDLYQLGDHRLLCGDSTDHAQVSRLMNGEKADMVFTDPPYGISIVKSGSDGATSNIGFVSPVNAPSPVAKARTYREIAGDDTPFDPMPILNMGIKPTVLWGANHYASKLPDKPQWLIWDKKIESGMLDHNNFSDCELAWTNNNAISARIYRHTWAGMLREGDRKEELKDRVHPTQKPVGLCEQIINDLSKESAIILDLYLGSGSTLIACEKTNRKCYGMEIDPLYCDVIVERWEKYTGKKAVLESSHGAS